MTDRTRRTERNGFAIDTNLFLFPTARRLLHGIALETGMNIYIVPEVDHEILGRENLRRTELRRWTQRQKRLGESHAAGVDIRSAIGEAASAWYESLFTCPESVFVRLEMSDSEEQIAHEVTEAMPKKIFRGFVRNEELRGDPLVIAQALVLNVDLLGTENLNTIDHDALNAWVRERTGRNHDLLHTASETALALCQDDVARAYKYCLTHGTWRISENEDENRSEFIRTLNVLTSAGFGQRRRDKTDTFRNLVYKVEGEFLFDTEFPSNFREALDSSHRELPMRVERELNTLVNQSVAHSERRRF